MRRRSTEATVDQSLRRRLVSLARRDAKARERLAADGSLFEGYHPAMQAVHEENAATLDSIVREHGWPTAATAGNDGAEAAWLIAQHAIGLPDFQRRCLHYLKLAAANGDLPAWQPAMLLDRIRVFEGRPQVYGTSFDWDDGGQMSPLPIEDAQTVDERRAEVGLPTLVESIARHRLQSEQEPRPANLNARRQQMEEWARRVGWR